MIVRSISFISVVALGGLYATGLLGGGSYSRDVGRAPADVKKALEDLDITEQPGSPGTDPAAAGGVKPVFKLSETPDSLIWTVWSRDKIATQMIAHLEPIDDGKGTRVTTSVKRGDAPDDFVSPAFRSKGLTMALFGGALESELNELTVAPAGTWNEDCDRIVAKFEQSNWDSPDLQQRDGLKDAMGDTITIAMKMQGVDMQLRNAGCNPDMRSNEFKSVQSRMAAASPQSTSVHPKDEVRFEPGKPMVDLSHYNRPSR